MIKVFEWNSAKTKYEKPAGDLFRISLQYEVAKYKDFTPEKWDITTCTKWVYF